MFDYDVSTLKDFTFNSIYDVFALIAQNYPVRSKYDIEDFEYKSDYLDEKKSIKLFHHCFLKNIKKNFPTNMLLKEFLQHIRHVIYYQ